MAKRPTIREGRPDLYKQLVSPETDGLLSLGSDKKVKWFCLEHGELNFIWEASVYNMTREISRGCPVCSDRKILVGWNDLSTTHPEVSAELVNKSLATRLSAGSYQKVEWSCLKHDGFECIWEAVVSSRTGKKPHGCPYCSGRKPIVGKTDLATTHPDLCKWLVDQGLGVNLSAHSNKKVKWFCLKHDGFECTWEASPNNRTGEIPSGCPGCCGQKVIEGYNDLGTTDPALCMELVDGTLATKLSYGSNRKVLWFCPKHDQSKYTWESKVCDRTKKNPSGCPACAVSGFDQSQPGLLYIWEYFDNSKRMVKVGISNLLYMEARGFEKISGVNVLHRAVFKAGSDAKLNESKLLDLIKENGGRLIDRKIYESVVGTKLSGHTETFADPEGDVVELLRSHLNGFSVDSLLQSI